VAVAIMQFWAWAAAPFPQRLGCLSLPPSMLRGTAKCISAFGLSKNKWQWWCGQQQLNSRLTAQVGWLQLGAGSHLAPSLHSPDEPGELSQQL